ncbi:hypothetical protein C0Q70_01526 [Pomacea canaliculata]|uniref:C1q domain-containing protein n=1 Tax=Pomacea canaliculata TaxID=400727 RepID=A0A2T7PZQ7_POMCA|nr:complement C1q tumor necrosis factor-related protein 4-like [Pomacea canaliculata]PVD38901.1 hypothetical protein C0Q70_01526 [Pomacea canaliculata]
MTSKIALVVASVYLSCSIASSDRNLEAENRTCECLEKSRDARSDDVDAITVVLDRHSQLIDDLTARLQALENRSQKKVVFSAHFSIEVIKDIGPGKTIIFDTAAFNIGNGYDPATGIFRAPYAGEYVFHIKILSASNNGIRLDVVTTPNNAIITTTEVWVHPDREVATAQSMVHLSAGQQVWVLGYPTNMNPPLTQLWGLIYSSFSGFLLYPD